MLDFAVAARWMFHKLIPVTINQFVTSPHCGIIKASYFNLSRYVYTRTFA